MSSEEKGTFFDKIKSSIGSSLPIVSFMDWQGCYALFSIHRSILSNGKKIKRIVVAHQGNWLNEEAMMNYKEVTEYEDAQSLCGKNLTFIEKEYVGVLNRTLIKYALDNDNAVLAIPATGEEIACEIYGCDITGCLFLLYSGEI